MNWLSNLLKSSLALALLLVLVAYTLPDRRLVERQKLIAVTPAQLWPLIASPRQWARWSPWHARDPQMRIGFDGPESGLGAQWSWDSAVQGRGRMRFDDVQMPIRLGYMVTFDGLSSGARGEFRLDPVAGGTRVTWALESQVGANALLRWFSLVNDYQLGRDFELGLERLASVANQP
jgi:uncharacterized protein YndB with AHSA1/START domain